MEKKLYELKEDDVFFHEQGGLVVVTHIDPIQDGVHEVWFGTEDGDYEGSLVVGKWDPTYVRTPAARKGI